MGTESPPRRVPRRRLRAIPVTLVLVLAQGTSCVYFNSYYNAQKYFRQAERARLEAGDRAGDPPGAGRDRPSAAGSYQGLYDKAVRKASIVLEKYPQSELVDDAMFLAGRGLYWQGDYQYASRSFQDLENNFRDSEYYDRARYWRGLCLQALGQTEEARTLLRALVEEGSQVGDRAGLRLGELASTGGDGRAAIEEYRATLERFPSTDLRAVLWLRIGEAQMAMAGPERLDSALAAFRESLAASPADSVEYRARLHCGRVQYLQSRLEEALATYTSLLREGKFRAWEGETRILIGQYYEERGSPTEALAEFERIRDDFPQTEVSAMALYQTGLLYLQTQGDRQRAQEYLEEVADERRGGRADSLASAMLRTCDELDGLVEEIYAADSTAAARLASAADPVAPEPVAEEAAADSSTGAAQQSAIPPGPLAAPADSTDPALEGYTPRVVAGEWLPLVSRRESRESADADKGQSDNAAQGRPARRPSPPRRSGERPTLQGNLFAAAEIYRDELDLADSAAVLYEALASRFPASDQVPRALYNLAWIHLEKRSDPEAARPILERLVSEFPATSHANAARRQLGLDLERTVEETAAAAFAEIEQVRLEHPSLPGKWLSRLDELARDFPGTHSAARAAHLAAWVVENTLADSAAAEERYDAVARDYPGTPFAKRVEERRQARQSGALAKLERGLVSLGQGLKPEERLRVIAVEPDSADSVELSRKYLGLAVRAHGRDQLTRAEGLYQLSLEQGPAKNGDARAGLGDVVWRQGYLEDAVEHLRRALKEGAASLLPQYRLFTYHTRASQVDSANHYLRLVLRRDRDSPMAREVADRFPSIGSAEPEVLDLTTLETIDLEPSAETLQLDNAFFGLKDPPVVRVSQAAGYPAGGTDSAAVVVDALVSPTGRPEQVEVFEGEEPFASLARTAVEQYSFYPAGGRDEQPKAVWVELVIPFAPPRQAAAPDAAASTAGRPGEPSAPASATADSVASAEADPSGKVVNE